MGKRGAIPGYVEWERDPNKLMLLKGWARDGYTNEQMAAKMGIATVTFYDWINKSANFANAVKTNKEIADYAVEQSLYKQALAGEGWAVCFWLKNRNPVKWRDKREIEHSGEINNPYDSLSEKELRALAKLADDDEIDND